MNRLKKILKQCFVATLAVACVMPAIPAQAKTDKVLVIGNSMWNNGYSYNSLVKVAATAPKKHTIKLTKCLHDCYSLEKHYDKSGLGKLLKSEYDYVIIQESSDGQTSTGKRFQQYRDNVYKIAKATEAKNSKVRIVLHSLHKSKNDTAKEYARKASNVKSIVSYIKKKNKNIDIVPMYEGKAFDYYKKHYNHYSLLGGDGHHPSPEGRYLEACCTYKAMYGKSPVGATYLAQHNYKNISKARTKEIQKTVDAVKLTSD